MANRFGIPEEVEKRIRERDLNCVYCHKLMICPYEPSNHSNSATIEQFREEWPFYWDKGLKAEDLAICCGRCNSSRSRKKLTDWFKSDYCILNKINRNSVSEPVKQYLRSLQS